jgi:sialidase-1
LEDGYDRNRILFSNPASTTARENLTVRLTYDEGKTWPVARQVHAAPAAYSCLAVLPDMTVACFYERGDNHPYEKLTLARFNVEWLTEGRNSLPK